MPLPVPVPGLVIRYGYLWHSEHLAGREEGKDRPCAIVAALRPADDAGESRRNGGFDGDLSKPLRVAIKSRPFASTAGIFPVVFACLQKRSKIPRSHLWNALDANGFIRRP